MCAGCALGYRGSIADWGCDAVRSRVADSGVAQSAPRLQTMANAHDRVNDDRPVLIIGGTRGTGLLIAHLLRRQEAVRVLARSPGRAAVFLGPDIEVTEGDVTKEHTLAAAVDGASHIVFTAGCRSGHPVGEGAVRATEYQGVVNTIRVARQVGFAGRFLYMTSSGVGTRSFWTVALNIYKGNTLIWRRRAEDDIRTSGFDYTIIRAGMLTNHPGGIRAIEVTQRPLPLSPRYRIGRADVAGAFVTALHHPRTVRTTFEIIWGPGTCQGLGEQFDRLVPDEARGPTRVTPDAAHDPNLE